MSVTAIPQAAAQPSNITSTAADATIEINWDDDASATSHVVKLFSSWGQKYDQTYENVTSRPFTANCLINGSNYSVQVCRSGAANCTAGPEAMPVSSLTAPTLEPNGNGTMRVSWTEDASKSYSVRHKTSGLDNPRDLWGSPESGVTSPHDVTGLENLKEHAFQVGTEVDASCPAGQRTGWAEMVRGSPFVPPTDLALTGKNQAIRADWTLAPAPARNLVEYRKETDTNWIRVEDDDGRWIWNRYTIPGLENGTSYLVRVGARYDGKEQWTAPLETMPFDPKVYPPVFSGEASAEVQENHTGTVLTATATHQDNDPITFSIKGNNSVITKDGAVFNLTTGGELTFAESPDYTIRGTTTATIFIIWTSWRPVAPAPEPGRWCASTPSR